MWVHFYRSRAKLREGNVAPTPPAPLPSPYRDPPPPLRWTQPPLPDSPPRTGTPSCPNPPEQGPHLAPTPLYRDRSPSPLPAPALAPTCSDLFIMKDIRLASGRLASYLECFLLIFNLHASNFICNSPFMWGTSSPVLDHRLLIVR